MKYTKKIRQKAKRLYLQGYTFLDIAEKINISERTIRNWKKEEKWGEEIENIFSIEEQINRLLALDDLSDRQIAKLDKLSRIYDRLTRKKTKRKRKEQQNKPLQIEVIGNLKTKFLDRLYPYQREIVLAPERFKILLKSRQIGFSYTIGGMMLINAIESNRDQIVLSASQTQADIVRTYTEKWAKELEIDLLPDQKFLIAPGGAFLKFLPSNFRTVQGHSGDLFLDEFAWHIHPERIYQAALPIITIGDRKLLICSTPYTKEDKFGEIWLDQENYKTFTRYRISIHDAIKAGLDVDLAAIKELFDEETFRLLYECQFAKDDDSLFTHNEIDDAREDLSPYTDNPVDVGMDIGRYRDLTAVAVAEKILNIVYVRYIQSFAKKTFAEQENIVDSLFSKYLINKLRIDKTGIGLNLAERLQAKYGAKIEGIWFTRDIKEQLALNAKKFFEDRKIRIPNDRELILHILSIKRKPTSNGFTYDSVRNEKVKHADLAWALFLSIFGFGKNKRKIIDTMWKILGF